MNSNLPTDIINSPFPFSPLFTPNSLTALDLGSPCETTQVQQIIQTSNDELRELSQGELSQATTQSKFKLHLCSGFLNNSVKFEITYAKDYSRHHFQLVDLHNCQDFQKDTNNKVYFLFCLHVTDHSGEEISVNYFDKDEYLIRCTSFTQVKVNYKVQFIVKKVKNDMSKHGIIKRIMMINKPGQKIKLSKNQISNFTLSLSVKIYFQEKCWETKRIELPSKIKGKIYRTNGKRKSPESSAEVVKFPLNNPRKRKSPESSGEVVKEFENNATQNNSTNISTTNDLYKNLLLSEFNMFPTDDIPNDIPNDIPQDLLISEEAIEQLAANLSNTDDIFRGQVLSKGLRDQSRLNILTTDDIHNPTALDLEVSSDPLWIFMRKSGLAGEKNRIYHLLKQHKVTLNELYQSPQMIREVLQSASEYIMRIHDVMEKSLKLSKIEPMVIKVIDLEKKPCFIKLSSQTSFPDGLNFNVRFGTKNSQTNQWVTKTTFWLPNLAPAERLCPVPNFKEFNNPNEQLVFSCTDKECGYMAQISLEQELAFTSRVEKISSQPLYLYYSLTASKYTFT